VVQLLQYWDTGTVLRIQFCIRRGQYYAMTQGTVLINRRIQRTNGTGKKGRYYGSQGAVLLTI
jgi:hypothetical protein